MPQIERERERERVLIGGLEWVYRRVFQREKKKFFFEKKCDEKRKLVLPTFLITIGLSHSISRNGFEKGGGRLSEGSFHPA